MGKFVEPRMALATQLLSVSRLSSSFIYAVPLLLLAAFVTLSGYRWLRVFYMDHKHNKGRFVLSRFNGLSNLVTIYRHIDTIYDFFVETYSIHLSSFYNRSQDDLLESPPSVYPNAIFTLPAFRLTTLSNPADVEHVLKKNFENYPKGQQIRTAFKDLLGEGIFAVDGHKWKTQRKTASHEFTVDKFRSFYMATFNRNTHTVLDIIKSKQGSQVEIQDLFQRYTLESIAELGFGASLGCLQSDEPPPFAIAFDGAQAQLWRRLATEQVTWKAAKFFRLGHEGKMRGWIKTLREFTQDVIDKRRRQLASQPDAVRTGGDILSRFMLMADHEGKALSDQQLRDVVLNFILAGRDTTSNALSWAIHLIGDHPDVEEKLREELQGIGSDPDYKEMAYKKRPYLHAVVHETLRLYPSVPMELKTAVNDDILPDGTFVPAGSCVTFSPYALGRNTGLWGHDAADFKPERWIDGQGEFQRASQYKFVAFNGGFRLCLGMDLAFLEIKTMLAHLLSTYRLSKVPGQQVEYAVTLTCPMKAGLNVVFTPVEQSAR